MHPPYHASTSICIYLNLYLLKPPQSPPTQLVLEYEAASAAPNITALSNLITTTTTNGSVTNAVQGQGVNVTVGLAAPVQSPYNTSKAETVLTPSVPGSINAPPSSSGGGVSSGAIVGIVAGGLVVIIGAFVCLCVRHSLLFSLITVLLVMQVAACCNLSMCSRRVYLVACVCNVVSRHRNLLNNTLCGFWTLLYPF